MAIVTIEEYRGWDILFNTEKERFYAQMDEEYAEKQSYASAKKYIDDFIKDNLQFKPFLAVRERGVYNEKEIVRVVGLRKDGRFVAEKEKNGKVEVTQIDPKPKWGGKCDYIVYLEENESLYAEIEKLYKEKKEVCSAIDEKINAYSSQIKQKQLLEILEMYQK